MAITNSTVQEVQVPEVASQQITFRVVGDSPIILNRLSEKAKRELLMPKGRKTAADKAQNLKHDPLVEFHASPHVLPDSYPAHLGILSGAFKKAMMTAALDIPGVKKAQIGRILYVIGEYTPIFGVPYLLMSATRSADMNRTPDIRTRVIIPDWAAEVSINFVTTAITAQSVCNLLSGAGVTAGVGDWRPEKGAGAFGTFHVTGDDRTDYDAIVNDGGREAQAAAMATPSFYNTETEELFTWYIEERERRGR